MTRRATLVSQQRTRNDQLLLLDAGDSLLSDDTQPMTLESQGALVVEAMNLLAYDAVALGERDLELGPTVLRQRVDQADFPFLSANLHLAGSQQLFVEPYVLVSFDEFVVGVIGLTGDASAVPAGFSVSDPEAAVQALVPEVAQQADIVILLSHLGWTDNVQLAELSAEVDLIVGGGVEQASGYVHTSTTTGTQLAQAERPSRGHAGRMVGMWELHIADGQLELGEWRIISLGPEFANDAEMVALLQRYR